MINSIGTGEEEGKTLGFIYDKKDGFFKVRETHITNSVHVL
jgi:hypothetical protein